MVTLPMFAIRLAATDAVNWVALTKVVGSVAPFHWTCAPETNPVPFTVSVNGPPPATTDAGLSVVMAGGALTGNVVAAVDVPFEFTRTLTLPVAVIRLAAT